MGDESPKTREAIRAADEAWRANEAPRTRTLPWWALALISIGGAVVPQLCTMIPNAVGSTVCQLVAKAAVAVATQQTGNGPLPPPVLDVPDCPPDRRLSTGQCLPPVVNQLYFPSPAVNQPIWL